MKGAQPNPTLIRGVLYPSQKAAAAALSVTEAAVSLALAEGRPDSVGLGITGAPHKPCYMNGRRYPSRKAAAEAIGCTRAAISRAIGQGKAEITTRKRAAS